MVNYLYYKIARFVGNADVTVMMTSSILCLTGLQLLQLWRYYDVTEQRQRQTSRHGVRGRRREGRGEGGDSL